HSRAVNSGAVNRFSCIGTRIFRIALLLDTVAELVNSHSPLNIHNLADLCFSEVSGSAFQAQADNRIAELGGFNTQAGIFLADAVRGKGADNTADNAAYGSAGQHTD